LRSTRDRGDGPETWEPRFTVHGFRYAEISGWPGDFSADAVRAVVVHSDLARTGRFMSSDALLDRFHENVVWSMSGNFVDLPTDCPQRDERLGWTGDIQVFAPTACTLFDVAGFLGSWLVDLALEQSEDGTVPFVVPKATTNAGVATAAWGDAATVVPWTLYERYGDEGVLAAQFPSMCAWVDRVAELVGPGLLWNRGFQFGDWLDPTAPPDRAHVATTPAEVVATACFARSADLVARAAAVLDRSAEAERYGALAEGARAAFRAEYATANGRVIPDAQTAYALALAFGLVSEAGQRARAGRRLAELVRANGHRIGTGFVGTPLICDALAETGHLDDAYRLLMQQECPSWLYPVTRGATTVWERWDAVLSDGSFNAGAMNSFNHYALGGVADWLYRTVAGLSAAEPGYRRLRIAPRPGGGLAHAAAELRTPYGHASVAWRIDRNDDGDRLTVNATVPANTTADVHLPGGEPLRRVGSGHHTWTVPLPRSARGPRPITLDTQVAYLRDDPGTWEILRGVIERHWPAAAERFADPDARPGTDLTLRQLGAFVPNGDGLLADLEARLADYAAAAPERDLHARA
jgi:alpha-L-rhamnosidase